METLHYLGDKGSVILDAKTQGQQPYLLLYQLTYISKVSGALKHDAKVDALAKGVEYFSGSLAKSEEEQALKEFEQRQI